MSNEYPQRIHDYIKGQRKFNIKYSLSIERALNINIEGFFSKTIQERTNAIGLKAVSGRCGGNLCKILKENLWIEEHGFDEGLLTRNG